jgi:spore maturation protein CgeB
MKWFKEETWYDFYTIPLAADKIVLKSYFEEKFKADISFIWTNLPQKKEFFNNWVFPLRKLYDLKLYWQDWTKLDKYIGFIEKVGQYFNIPVIKSLRKPKLKLEDEWVIYNSSVISINVHEDYQRKFWWDCNERTFKVPLCWWFEIVDDVECIKKYFKEWEEIIIANNKEEWFSKIDFYIKNPDERLKIIEAWRRRVLKDHTYHNRVEQIINIYNWKNV